MIKIFVYSCLLSALSIVQMKPLNIDGRVGKNVTIKCSDWNVWTNVKYNDKYLCESPCTQDNHIIIKAAFGKTTHKNRIELTNNAEGLFVTFTNLQMSDSKEYICGVEKLGFDSFIQVNLKVTEDESFSLKTTPTTVIAGSTLSVSSDGSPMITDMSTSNIIHSSTTTTTSSATQGAGMVYLIVGIIVIITILMVLLKLMMKTMKKQLKEEEEEEEGREDPAVPDGVYQTLDPFTKDEDQVYSTIKPTERNAVLESMSMATSSGS